MGGYCISPSRDRVHVLFELLAVVSLPIWWQVAQQLPEGGLRNFVYVFMGATLLVDGGLLVQRLSA